MILTDENCEEYLKKNYQNSHFFNEQEFQEDILRIVYIKKLITRYLDNGPEELRERLILNHIVILNNVFGPVATTRVLFLKLNHQLKELKPFLVMLNLLPRFLFNIAQNEKIDTDIIPMDEIIVERLRLI